MCVLLCCVVERATIMIIRVSRSPAAPVTYIVDTRLWQDITTSLNLNHFYCVSERKLQEERALYARVLYTIFGAWRTIHLSLRIYEM